MPVRVWHRPQGGAGAKHTRSNAPLVSQSRVSAPIQRLVAVSLFGALQAAKLASAFASPGSLSSAVMWGVADVVYLWVLRIFAVEWLRFSSGVLGVMSMLLVSIDLTLFGYGFLAGNMILLGPRVLFRLLFGSSPQGPGAPTLAGGRYNGVDSHEHLLGRYVVEFLPESSASMNTLEPLCIGAGTPEVWAHLTFNASWPKEVRLAYASLSDTDGSTAQNIQHITFSTKTLSKFPMSQDSGELWVPIAHPGVYKLAGAVDSATHMSVRVLGSDAIVVPECPTASLVSGSTGMSPNPSRLPELCAGEPVTASLKVRGLAPLRVQVENEWFDVPANSAGFEVIEASVPLQKHSNDAGSAGFSPYKIVDALGNEATLGGFTAVANILRPPEIQLAEPGRRWPLVDAKNGMIRPTLHIAGDDRALAVSVRINGSETTNVPVDQFEFDAAGSYELVGAQGRICSGTARGAFEVFEPPLLGLDVEFEQVRDKCVGPSGINADLRLQGTPPFRVWYRTLKDGRQVVSQRVADVAELEGRVQFKPLSVGHFTYQFTAVEDQFRRLALSGDEYVQDQTINELGGAAWSSQQQTGWCHGSSVMLGVVVQGKGPLQLSYELVSPSGTHHHTIYDMAGGSLKLDLGQLEGGTHFARLLSVTDGRNCTTDLGGVRSPDLVVRSRAPEAALSGPRNVRVVDARIKLPVSISAEAYHPLWVTISRNGGPGFEVPVQGAGSATSVPISEPGTYQLVGFRDAECPGEVELGEPVTVSLLERPTIAVATEPVALCVGSPPQSLVLKLGGQAPFTIWHEVVDPQGVSRVDKHTTKNEELVVKAPATIPGSWKHYWHVTDAHYSDFRNENSATSAVVTVNSAPDAAWRKPGSTLSMCASSRDEDAGVPVVLRGQPPFTVVVEGRNGRQRWNTEESVGSTASKLHKVVADAPVGTSTLRLVSVRDKTGCEHLIDAKAEWNRVVLERKPAPSLDQTNADNSGTRHVCVGDRVSLGLHGEPPFELDFVFAGRSQRTRVSESPFGRFADNPGNLTLRTLRDAGGCSADLSGAANPAVQVHALPSSRITHEPVFSIYHGDTAELSFEFEGVPPFAFTYTRNVGGKEVERQTVRDIWDYRHSVYTSEDGVYEVVALEDAWCRVEA